MVGRPPGLPKTGGRQKGTPNKTTAERKEAILAAGLTPLEYMLNVLRDEQQTPERRMDAAKSAAPYIHPRLANIEQQTKLSGADGGVVQFEDVTRALESALEKVKQKRGDDV